MPVHPRILEANPQLNPEQQQAIGTLQGPLAIIAGPGSGKTRVLVLRTLNLLLLGEAKPEEIVLCTFTEKGAFELRDRLLSESRRVGLSLDLGRLSVGTIHSLCARLIAEEREASSWPAGFTILDETEQKLFVHERRREIVGDGALPLPYADDAAPNWYGVRQVCLYADRMTEELIDPLQVARGARASGRTQLHDLAMAAHRYDELLVAEHRIDYAHLLSEAHRLLQIPAVAARVQARARFVMIDEHQDTNYVQEQLLRTLAAATGNLCVVGDEDQAIYRFRGATVRNILEFALLTPGCATVALTTNYRSHPRIIASCGQFLAQVDWRGAVGGAGFRHHKTIVPDPGRRFADYPAVVKVRGRHEGDEGEQVAELVAMLKRDGVIGDYNQVAILLASVKPQHSARYTDALEARGIPFYCPRARGFFERPEIRHIVGSFLLVLNARPEPTGMRKDRTPEFGTYLHAVRQELIAALPTYPDQRNLMRPVADQLAALRPGETVELRLADLFFRMMAHEPFRSYLRDDTSARNLARFSQLLATFQRREEGVVTAEGLERLRERFFGVFLDLFYAEGVNEYEDVDEPFPPGHVQVMTIHQAKGLEFPVVIVGTLEWAMDTDLTVDDALEPYKRRLPLEPADMITEFDQTRQYYVAMSRAQHLLAFTSTKPPKERFRWIVDGAPDWRVLADGALARQRFVANERAKVKRRYSFTGHLTLYETCPRQYEVFRARGFSPSRTKEYFFGTLVHESIERVHRRLLEGQQLAAVAADAGWIVDEQYRHLVTMGLRPIGDRARADAREHVARYIAQNRDMLARVTATEVRVTIDKEGYLLVGKVDLMLGAGGGLDLIDFKASKRPEPDAPILESYHLQLCTYAHILESLRQRPVDRLFLYWTGEETRERALMELPNRPELVASAAARFDRAVDAVRDKRFAVASPPPPAICAECDWRHVCVQDGTIAAG